MCKLSIGEIKETQNVKYTVPCTLRRAVLSSSLGSSTENIPAGSQDCVNTYAPLFATSTKAVRMEESSHVLPAHSLVSPEVSCIDLSSLYVFLQE